MKYKTGEIVKIGDNIKSEFAGEYFPARTVYIHETKEYLENYDWCIKEDNLNQNSIFIEWKFPEILAKYLWPTNPDQVPPYMQTTIDNDDDIKFQSRKYPAYIKVDNFHIDPSGTIIDKLHKLLINIEGDLTYIENKKLITITNLTVIELADQLEKWMLNEKRDNFYFNTMDDDDKNVFCIINNNNHWKIRSSWSDTDFEFPFEENMIKNLIDDYTYSVYFGVQRHLSIDCGSFGIIRKFG